MKRKRTKLKRSRKLERKEGGKNAMTTKYRTRSISKIIR
jgi:hypothetical protein